jgi:hypothetical protein
MATNINLEFIEEDYLPTKTKQKTDFYEDNLDLEVENEIKTEVNSEIKTEIHPEIKAEIVSETKVQVESELENQYQELLQDVFEYSTISQCVGKCKESFKPCSDCLIFKVNGSVHSEKLFPNQGNSLRGIDNCLGATRSVIQVGSSNIFFNISNQKLP